MTPLESKPWRIEHFPMLGIPRALIALLLWEDGDAVPAAGYYALKLLQEGLADETTLKRLQAIARCYTFASAKLKSERTADISSRELLNSYVLSRLEGSVERTDYEDRLALFWSPASWSQVSVERYALEKFAAFLRAEGPRDPDPLRNRINEILSQYVKNSSAGDMLAQMEAGPWDGNGKPERDPSEGKKRKRKKPRLPKMILPEAMIEMVETGARAPRDKMLLLLLGYAACRTCEPLHTYAQDVEERFASSGATRVRFPHPSDSMLHWTEGGRSRNGSRRQYLWSVFGRYPRHELGIAHPEYAGWKGMTFQSTFEQDQYAIWIEEEVTGCYFQTLLEEYLRENPGIFLSGRLQHPYLFVNTDKRKSVGNYGAPMRKENLRRVFYEAASRIGIEATPHMAKHHAGYYLANIATLDKEVARIIMRHAVVESTEIYFQTHPDLVRGELRRALKPNDTQFEPAFRFSRPTFPNHWR